MPTCLDYGIDYPHGHVHCPACHADWLEARTVAALEEANVLKRQELALRQEDVWVEPKPQPRPRQTYMLPAPTPKPQKGGMQIEPR